MQPLNNHPLVHWLAAADWPAWDRFAAGHPLGGLVHTSAWKSVIEQSFSHIRACGCALTDRTSGEILAGLPIYKVTSPLLGARLVSVPFATLSDPLVADGNELSRLMEAVREETSNLGVTRIEIRCTHAPEPCDEVGWSVDTAFKHHVLPLDRSPAELLASTHPRAVRAMIARAERLGLRYRADDSQAGLHAFYRLFLDTRRRLALPPIPFAFFRSLHENLVPLGAMSYALVQNGPILAGAGLIFKWRATSAIEYLGDRLEHRHDGVNQMLYWGAIREAVQENRGFFSFGRTAVGNGGLLQYKRRWGTRESDLKTLVYPASQRVPGAARENCWRYRLVRRLCSVAPMPLYRLLGHFCYRHLG